mmetsp:Transcript_113000/g.319662  ORF Transcript_113000/g.319662 Transcript_113000/m.319662 type:complete len:500 (+) Transcript_113000:53-1552(+)
MAHLPFGASCSPCRPLHVANLVAAPRPANAAALPVKLCHLEQLQPPVVASGFHTDAFDTAQAFVVGLLFGVGAARLRRKCGSRVTQRLRAARGAVVGDTVRAADSLAEWLRARGTIISDAICVVSEDPVVGSRGCVATRAVEQGELLMELPLACCFAAAPGVDDALGPLVDRLDTAGINVKDAALAVAFAEEKSLGENSPWWPYVACVGEAEMTFPFFFNSDDLDALQSPSLAASLSEKVEALRAVAAHKSLDEKSFLAAYQLVLGRRFGTGDERYMLPHGDLLNHSFTPTCKFEDPQKGANPMWRLIALRRISPGEALNFEYCQDSNHLLLATSGFVVGGNPFNRIMARPADLRRGLRAVCNAGSPDDFARFRSEEFEKQLPDPEEESMSMYLVGKKNGLIQWNPLWLNLCGLAVTMSPTGPHWSQLAGGTAAYCAAVEDATWTALFDTTLEQDASKLEGGGLTENGRLALRFRMGQKELLKEALDTMKAKMISSAAA